MGDEQPFVWCVVANVTRDPHPEGPDGEMRLGTKRFAPGAKLYCFSQRWGDGAERLRVLGRHRGGGPRLIEIVVSTRFLTNWRAQKVYHPLVVQAMTPPDWWEDGGVPYEWDEQSAKEFAECMNQRVNR